MYKSPVLILLILICATSTIVVNPVFSQNQQPKIGLVLSGGGAKGIAHVRILQVLDSLGIVPDFVAGTSMGSVVGALYASGYNAHQIDSVTKAIHWGSLFSNSVSFEEINIEEKDEFGRYIYELPLMGVKPQLPLGLVEGQNIEELLSSLFFPVNAITDFNKLPTPFLCVASDIVKGEPVILSNGNLVSAVRASMSIPTVFTPVRIGNRLLVDGGVYVNLPVEYCKKMGADFIIAVDVGGGLMREDELTSAAQLLMQTTFLASNFSYEKEKGLSDIFIDVFKHLKYSTMDFEQGASMMQSGDLAVKEVMPQLVELSNRMKAYPARKKSTVSNLSQRYKLQNINTDGVSSENQDLVVEKFGWRSGDVVSRDQISASVHKLMGTRLFNKVSYTIEGDTITSSLTIRASEKPPTAVKFAIHYDTDRGAGLILNYTKRNLLIRSSRLVTTLDLAENPRARINYFYYLGNKSRWWHQTEVYGERVLSNSFIDGTPIPDVVDGYISAVTQLNRTIDQNSMWGIGALWQWTEIKPKIDPRTELNPDPISIIKYNFRTFGGKVHYQSNTFDRVYFPTTGKWIRVEAKGNFNNPFKAQLFRNSTSSATDTLFNGLVQSYLRLNIRAQKNVLLNEKISLQLIGQVGLTQQIFTQSDRYSAYTLGAGDFIAVGGQLQRPRANNFIFVGLKEAELSAPQVMIATAQLQYTVSKNIFITPTVNMLAAGYDAADFWTGLGDFNFSEGTTGKAFYQVGYGVSAGYMSLIGPIQVAVSSNAQVEKVRWFLNIGFNL
jgi:NTE family protein